MRGLPLVAASGGHSSSWCAGLSLSRPLVAEHRLQTRRLSNCGSRAQLLRGMWDLPRPGVEPVSPALAGRFSTTEPPEKSPLLFFNGLMCQPKYKKPAMFYETVCKQPNTKKKDIPLKILLKGSRNLTQTSHGKIKETRVYLYKIWG